LNTQKPRGSFAKPAGTDRYWVFFDFNPISPPPFDLDPSVQTRSARGVRDARPPATNLAAARLRLTGVGKVGRLGDVFERSLAWKGERAAVSTSGRSGGQKQDSGMQRDGEGGIGSPASGTEALACLKWKGQKPKRVLTSP